MASSSSGEKMLPHDHVDLHEGLYRKIVPWSQSPFREDDSIHLTSSDDQIIGLIKQAARIQWSDLLLDLVFTTAVSGLACAIAISPLYVLMIYADISQGTPIDSGTGLASFISFFALVWWFWASQVAYMVRFRQRDWLNRVFAFLQLFLFGFLAAFSNGFDITTGLTSRAAQEQEVQEFVQLEEQVLGAGFRDVNAFLCRSDHLPAINARGISLSIALSKLLLFIEYGVVYFYTLGLPTRPIWRRALFHQILPLIFSFVCYIVAYALQGNMSDDCGPTKGREKAKIVLWYVPLLVEVVSHFAACGVRGAVPYPRAMVFERAATLFTIILGAGLDRNTEGFQSVVGNVNLSDGNTAALAISGAFIFITQFSLYFGMNDGRRRRPSDTRILSWFFFHFLFLAALIVMLEGMASLLKFASFEKGLQDQNTVASALQNFMVLNPGQNVSFNSTEFTPFLSVFNNTGSAFAAYVIRVNEGIVASPQPPANKQGAFSNATLPPGYLGMIQQTMDAIVQVLANFDALPEPESLLDTQLAAFTDQDVGLVADGTSFLQNYTSIYNELLLENGGAIVWFYPAAGLTLLFIAVLMCMKYWPRDKFEYATLTSRVAAGVTLCALAALDVRSGNPIVSFTQNAQLTQTKSRIWTLSPWNVPVFALVLLLEQCIELVIAGLARRDFWRQTGNISPGAHAQAQNHESRAPAGPSFEQPRHVGGGEKPVDDAEKARGRSFTVP